LSIDWKTRSVIICGNINSPSLPREHDMDLQALQFTLRDFAAKRDWQPFHTPKNLSTALMVEAAELAEIFQWMTSVDSQRAHTDEATKERIADEVADVLLYLLQLADHCAIDLPQAVANKLVKNAIKHPIAPAIAPLN
jgi:NTP pyrophosphatase (non-canonical NTP hydrolase)